MIQGVRKPSYQVLRCQSYRSMPWRNGRGSTLEIARDPATGEEFAWRLSLADIEQDGDFSEYPGYRRALALIAGNSLHLRFKGHGHCLLEAAGRGTRFEGDWKTHCAVPDGRCTDLSLIVRRGRAGRPASVVRAPSLLRLKPTGRLVLSGDLYAALFVLDRPVAITESAGARSHTVRARDTLLVSPGLQRTLTLRSLGRSSTAEVILLQWRPGRPRRSSSRKS